MKNILNSYLLKHLPFGPVVESIPFNGTTIRIVRAAGKAVSRSSAPALLISVAIDSSIKIGQAIAAERRNHR